MKKLLVIIFGLSLLFSCQPSGDNNETTADNDNLNLAETDTFVSLGDEVVFLRPTEEEIKILVKEGADSIEIYDNDAYYTYYSNKFAGEVKSRGIKIADPHERVIEIVAFDNTKSYVNRVDNGNNLYGIIINSKEHEPRVEFGIFNESQLLKMLN